MKPAAKVAQCLKMTALCPVHQLSTSPDARMALLRQLGEHSTISVIPVLICCCWSLCSEYWMPPQSCYVLYACLDTCCNHFLTIMDLHCRHKSELPVCRTRGLNSGRCSARQGCWSLHQCQLHIHSECKSRLMNGKTDLAYWHKLFPVSHRTIRECCSWHQMSLLRLEILKHH